MPEGGATRVAIGADNLGYPLKETVKAHLVGLGHEVATILVDIWLAAEFQGGSSARKVAKIEALDSARRSD